MSNYVDLTADNLLEITDQLDDATLLTYCQTNKDIAALCDHKVWLHRIFKYNLIPLLPQAILYPSLKDFYLNIRHDAIYEVAKDYMENGREKSVNEYYVNVKDVYDALRMPVNPIYKAIILRINNKKYNINYRSIYGTAQYDDNVPFVTSFEEILKFPNLEPRSLIIITEYGPANVTGDSLRDLHRKNVVNDTIYIKNIGPGRDIFLNFNKFRWGFYQTERNALNKILILLDQSLVDRANGVTTKDNNYYVVVVPRPVQNSRIYNGFILERSEDEVDYSSLLLAYIEESGTYYKLQELLTLLTQ